MLNKKNKSSLVRCLKDVIELSSSLKLVCVFSHFNDIFINLSSEISLN